MNMMSDTVIQLNHVSKKFRLFPNQKARMIYALNPRGSKKGQEFFALNDINMNVKQGEILGIIGRNGSGKSTLLKVISGILTPSEGTVETRGKIIPLIELGAGFHPNFTGLENIYFYTVILGYSRKQIDQLIPEIIEFSELGDFINQPIKNYSSGMKSRLAFSVSILVDPDILILDEVLSVGDEYFKEKSFKRMNKFFESGKTILFVSHSPQQISELCQRAVLIDKGEIIDSGDTQTVTTNYKKFWNATGAAHDAMRTELKSNLQDIERNSRNQ
jgi:ABC-type polysaccharide/polyol phosphate transport system ATPase subunit